MESGELGDREPVRDDRNAHWKRECFLGGFPDRNTKSYVAIRKCYVAVSYASYTDFWMRICCG